MKTAWVLAVVLGAAAPATASAATVAMPIKYGSLDPEGKVGYQQPELRFAAAAGETNALRVALNGPIANPAALLRFRESSDAAPDSTKISDRLTAPIRALECEVVSCDAPRA
jgi:hypothetical protein